MRITGDWHCDTSAPYTVQVMSFKEYVKSVLPNEFYPSQPGQEWSVQTYQAGAIAVKMYAWYWIAHGGKWPDADVYDSTCDQLYRPRSSRPITDRAVDSTWNWVLSRKGDLFQTSHKQSATSCTRGYCMSQLGAQELARKGYSWDEILRYFYFDSTLTYRFDHPAGFALLLNSQPGDNQDQILIPIAYPQNDPPLLPTNIGDEDFTIEWWMMSDATQNADNDGKAGCAENQDWNQGSILVDRPIPENTGGFGVSLSHGHIVFGVKGENGDGMSALCSSADVIDGQWHHIAVQRQRTDGMISIFIDGSLDTQSIGPQGDISLQDNSLTDQPDLQYLSIGGRQVDSDLQQAAYHGWIDEIRISNAVRYSENFLPPVQAFSHDEFTLALYHLDEGFGDTLHDVDQGNNSPTRAILLSVASPDLLWRPSTLFIAYSFNSSLPLLAKP